MPATVFRDFDEFADAINGIAGRFAPTARAEAGWSVQVVPIGRLAIQQVQTGGPMAFVGDGKDNAVTIGIPTTTPGHIQVDGCSLGDNSFILVNEGQPFAVGALRATRWAGITVPIDHPFLAPDLVQSLKPRAPGGRRTTHTQAEAHYVSGAKTLVSRLFAAEADLGRLEGAAARTAEEQLLFVASHALHASSRSEYTGVGRPRLSRDRVIARSLALIESRAGRPLFVEDLCRATQVSERTLRTIFHEYFGVGPLRLIKVNQLREIRAALLAADPADHWVCKIAGSFGVWDMSLFARNYKTIFGESPHEALRSAAPLRSRDSAMNATWIRYASRKLAEASAPRRG